jgi:DNA-binding beta-propeller fold protein YncE
MKIWPRAAKLAVPASAIVAAALFIAFALARVPVTASVVIPEVGSYGQPRFGVDPTWPKELPNNWIVGQVGGLSVDKENDIWVYQRPYSDTSDELDAAQSPQAAICCYPAPPVLEFDTNGNLLNAWGPIENITCCAPGTTVPGRNPNNPEPTNYNYVKGEHGIFADDAGYVWITGNASGDRQILKFTRNGTFVMQIGTPGTTCSNLDTVDVCKAAMFYVDVPNNELYVADGYGNNRIVVFNATTGKFKRAWGAFGVTATSGAVTTGFGVIPPLQATYPPFTYTAGHPSYHFANPVHCVTKDPVTGYIWVCDRVNDRIQVFTPAGAYIGQCYFAQSTLGPGSTWDTKFYPRGSNRVMLSADGTNNIVRAYLPIPSQTTGTTTPSSACPLVGGFGHNGRNAGYFHWVHVADVDAYGNYYEGEVDTGKRVQKFTPTTGGRQF